MMDRRVMTIVTKKGSCSIDEACLVTEVWQRQGTRLVVASPRQPVGITDHCDILRRLADAHLHREGAVLFRGFLKLSAGEFREFAAGFRHEMLTYDFASTPRSAIEDGVYSSTEYPAHQWIPQHSEHAYTTRWPLKIWFYCDIPADGGGETPIADCREVYRKIDPAIRQRFAQKRLMYVRNYGNGLDLPWQQVFRTSERSEVEAFCRREQITCDWLSDGRLRTRQICQSEARHPITGEMVWFNQAHLFHVSGLEPQVREALLAVVDDEADLPRNVYYGDGSPIEESILDEIRSLYDQLTLRFAWQEGDLLMLDNMLTSHGRAPFKGKRRVLVTMAQPWPS
jgi:alpha-ketoglutarate-dependent taurine dioxygenase